MKAALILIATVALAACSPSVKCDDAGLIIIPEGELRQKDFAANIDLKLRRAEYEAGMSSRWTDPKTLAKVDRCPA